MTRRECIVCDMGRYAPGGGTSCDECIAGLADLDMDASTPCDVCRPAICWHIHSAVQLVLLERADEDSDPSTPCTLCGPGTFAAGATRREVCEAGRADLDVDPSSPCEVCVQRGSTRRVWRLYVLTALLGARILTAIRRHRVTNVAPAGIRCFPGSLACELYDIPVHAYRCTCTPGFANGVCDYDFIGG